ncbi:hypothetical protein D3C76_1311880 [compost metagenome]
MYVVFGYRQDGSLINKNAVFKGTELSDFGADRRNNIYVSNGMFYITANVINDEGKGSQIFLDRWYKNINLRRIIQPDSRLDGHLLNSLHKS